MQGKQEIFMHVTISPLSFIITIETFLYKTLRRDVCRKVLLKFVSYSNKCDRQSKLSKQINQMTVTKFATLTSFWSMNSLLQKKGWSQKSIGPTIVQIPEKLFPRRFFPKYQPSGARGTRSPPATPHSLHNPKRPLGGPKMAVEVWKGLYPQDFGCSCQLSRNKFFDPITPSMRKVDDEEEKNNVDYIDH